VRAAVNRLVEAQLTRGGSLSCAPVRRSHESRCAHPEAPTHSATRYRRSPPPRCLPPVLRIASAAAPRPSSQSPAMASPRESPQVGDYAGLTLLGDLFAPNDVMVLSVDSGEQAVLLGSSVSKVYFRGPATAPFLQLRTASVSGIPNVLGPLRPQVLSRVTAWLRCTIGLCSCCSQPTGIRKAHAAFRRHGLLVLAGTFRDSRGAAMLVPQSGHDPRVSGVCRPRKTSCRVRCKWRCP